jgi:hypothetical protein
MASKSRRALSQIQQPARGALQHDAQRSCHDQTSLPSPADADAFIDQQKVRVLVRGQLDRVMFARSQVIKLRVGANMNLPDHNPLG